MRNDWTMYINFLHFLAPFPPFCFLLTGWGWYFSGVVVLTVVISRFNLGVFIWKAERDGLEVVGLGWRIVRGLFGVSGVRKRWKRDGRYRLRGLRGMRMGRGCGGWLWSWGREGFGLKAGWFEEWLWWFVYSVYYTLIFEFVRCNSYYTKEPSQTSTKVGKWDNSIRYLLENSILIRCGVWGEWREWWLWERISLA